MKKRKFPVWTSLYTVSYVTTSIKYFLHESNHEEIYSYYDTPGCDDLIGYSIKCKERGCQHDYSYASAETQ